MYAAIHLLCRGKLNSEMPTGKRRADQNSLLLEMVLAEPTVGAKYFVLAPDNSFHERHTANVLTLNYTPFPPWN